MLRAIPVTCTRENVKNVLFIPPILEIGSMRMRKNRVKEMLRAGQATVGVFVGVGHPEVAEIMAHVGFDWIVFDMEHGPLGIETVQSMIQATSGTDTVPLVRVAWNDPVLIKRALDIGAYGLVIPWVNTRDEALKAVRACKYPTAGIRGVGPRRASKYGLEIKDYLAMADEEIMVIVQIEHIDAVNNIDEILSVDGVDASFIGPWDLSASMGLLRELPELHPKVTEAINKVLEAGKRTGVPAGIYAGSVESANDYIAQGFQFVALTTDVSYLLRAKEDLEKIVR
jgi:2-keto-3-deoxy-L-rhamnonate aldolase RhmA